MRHLVVIRPKLRFFTAATQDARRKHFFMSLKGRDQGGLVPADPGNMTINTHNLAKGVTPSIPLLRARRTRS